MREFPSLRALMIVTLMVSIVYADPAFADESDGVERESAADADAKSPAQAELLEESRSVRREANVEGVASQKEIDEISDTTERLFARYKNTLRQIDSTRVYNQQMETLVAAQKEEVASLSGQLDIVEEVGRDVTPLMLRMIDALAVFVKLDVPFLTEERQNRLEDLRKMMNRADVTTPEKYRRIMEAYQIENEYGRTIEAYRSTIERDGKEITVDFLRFGRVALVYQSLDESEAGMWNIDSQSWQPLDSSYRTAIREGIRIARKQAAPSLIRLPLPPAQTAEGAS